MSQKDTGEKTSVTSAVQPGPLTAFLVSLFLHVLGVFNTWSWLYELHVLPMKPRSTFSLTRLWCADVHCDCSCSFQLLTCSGRWNLGLRWNKLRVFSKLQDLTSVYREPAAPVLFVCTVLQRTWMTLTLIFWIKGQRLYLYKAVLPWLDDSFSCSKRQSNSSFTTK